MADQLCRSSTVANPNRYGDCDFDSYCHSYSYLYRYCNRNRYGYFYRYRYCDRDGATNTDANPDAITYSLSRITRRFGADTRFCA